MKRELGLSPVASAQEVHDKCPGGCAAMDLHGCISSAVQGMTIQCTDATCFCVAHTSRGGHPEPLVSVGSWMGNFFSVLDICEEGSQLEKGFEWSHGSRCLPALRRQAELIRRDPHDDRERKADAADAPLADRGGWPGRRTCRSCKGPQGTSGHQADARCSLRRAEGPEHSAAWAHAPCLGLWQGRDIAA